MAIKSKSFKAGKPYHPFYYVACILTVLLFVTELTVGIATTISISNEERSLNEIFQMKDFRYSRGFTEKYDSAAQQVSLLLSRYHDRDYILSGGGVDPEELEAVAQERYDRQEEEENPVIDGASEPESIPWSAEAPLTDQEDVFDLPEETAMAEGQVSPEDGLTAGPGEGDGDLFLSGEGEEVSAGVAGTKEQTPEADRPLPAQIREEVRQEMIQSQLKEYLQIQNELAANGICYYASDGATAVTNLPGYDLKDKNSQELKELFTCSGAWSIIEGGKLTMEPRYEGSPYNLRNSYLEELSYQNSYNADYCLYLSFTDEALAAEEAAFYDDQSRYREILPALGIGLLVVLILLAYQIAACGRRDERGQIIYNRFDRLFTELHLIILVGALVIGGIGYISLMESAFYRGTVYGYGFFIEGLHITVGIDVVLAVAIAVAAAFIGEGTFLAMIKNIKGGRFWSNSLLGRICRGLKEVFVSFYNGGSMERKAILLTFGLVTFSSLCFFLYPLTIVAALVAAMLWAKRYEKIKEGTRRVKEGELSYTIDVEKGELGKLAANINDISKGLDAAVQNRMKNERMRSELISNVSHDLKTPLTSIVSYIDLLKKEGLDSPNAPHYLDVIDRKANRLQKLTLDLFEAAKVSSGSIQVEMGKVELRSLVDQGLGEMEDKITASGLEFIVNAKEEKFYVEADGRLLWRVVENLLTNVLKYAQENSRVYIDLKKTRHQGILVMKNVSRNRLNISSDELMERFKRGDESRSTEGSGLGLAIARDLVRLQKGAFDISIDGDLFKATVILRLYPEPLQIRENPAAEKTPGTSSAALAKEAGCPSEGEEDEKGEIKAERAKFGFAAGKAEKVKKRFRKPKNFSKPPERRSVMAEMVDELPPADLPTSL